MVVPNKPMDQTVWDGLAADFSKAHEQSYGFKKDDPMEIVSLRLSVVGQADHTDLYAMGEKGNGKAEPAAMRKAYFMGKWMDTGVYNRDLLKCGDVFMGPAIIEETGATSVVGPGDRVMVDDRKNLIVQIADNETCRTAVEAAR